MQNFANLLTSYLARITLPDIRINDVAEIILISFFIYQFMVWVKTTRAYSLLKGILMILAFFLLAYIFNLSTILYIIRNLANVLIIGVIVIFQPELRKVLEQLGQKQIISTLFPFDSTRDHEDHFTEKTINELVKASFDMSAVCTGALIVLEREIRLAEYERTGIKVDAVLTSQLLINIFEHNTPLHDGAVLVRGNRIVAATCYLPLSDNMELNKQLGTRHRAGVGISEVSDSLTIIVSEETGAVSVAEGGSLTRCLTPDSLKKALVRVKRNVPPQNTRLRKLLKGRVKNASEKTDS